MVWKNPEISMNISNPSKDYRGSPGPTSFPTTSQLHRTAAECFAVWVSKPYELLKLGKATVYKLHITRSFPHISLPKLRELEHLKQIYKVLKLQWPHGLRRLTTLVRYDKHLGKSSENGQVFHDSGRLIEGLPPMPPTPNRGDSKVGCERSKQWFGDGWQVSGILQPFCVWDAHAKRQNPSRFCAQAIAKPQPEKCRNVAFGTH